MAAWRSNKSGLVRASILAACQALSMGSLALIVAMGSVLGAQLATAKELATVPITVMLVGVMIMVYPASKIMRRFGRRTGFLIGNFLGVLGGTVLCTAVYNASFLLVLIATFLIGNLMAFAQFYRLAAIDNVPEELRPRAISLVLIGGVFAAFLGPWVAEWSAKLTPELPFLWAGLGVVAACGITMVLLMFVKFPISKECTPEISSRTLCQVFESSESRMAVLVGLSGYFVMSLLMNTAPLEILHQGHSFDYAAQAVQWHMVAMFLPSLVTGHIFSRIGVGKGVALGFIFFGFCIALGVIGTSYFNLLACLILLGLAWNFSYIGSTILLAKNCRENEKSRAQGFNEFVLSMGNTVASFLSGAILFQAGWFGVNCIAAAILVITLFVITYVLNLANSGRAKFSDIDVFDTKR